MEVFQVTLQTMCLLLIFVIIGFVLQKMHMLPGDTDIVLSRLENYVFSPAVVLSTFIGKCTIENISARWNYIVISAAVILVMMPIVAAMVKRMSRDSFERNVFRYSLMLSNFGFFGIPLVRTVFGQDALFDFLIYALPMYALVYSFGIIWLIPSDDNRITPKRFLNPVCVSLLIGMVLGIAGFGKIMPPVISDVLDTAGDCMGPVAMILTGFVIAGYDIRKLLGDKRIYLMTLLRLLIIPGLGGVICTLFHVDANLKMLVLCSLAMPFGLNTIVFPAAYGGDTTPGASCALISSVLSTITIPLLFMIFL